MKTDKFKLKCSGCGAQLIKKTRIDPPTGYYYCANCGREIKLNQF